MKKNTDEDYELEPGLYEVRRKKGTHVTTKESDDGYKTGLSFDDDGNDLTGPVQVRRVDESEYVKTEYVEVEPEKQSIGDMFIQGVLVPIVSDAMTRAFEYGFDKLTTCLEEKAVPAVKKQAKKGWENVKLYASAVKDVIADKPTKVEQILAEREKAVATTKASKLAVKVAEQKQKEPMQFELSPEEVEALINQMRSNALMLAASVNILNNSVVMDDGSDPMKIEAIRRGIDQLSSKEITAQMDMLLEDKNRGLLNAASLEMLRSFREGMFVGDGEPIPVSRYIEKEQ